MNIVSDPIAQGSPIVIYDLGSNNIDRIRDVA